MAKRQSDQRLEMDMRTDESKERKVKDLDALRGYLNSLPEGHHIPINEWYQEMARLGLGRSDRQRLSDLRKEGYSIQYDHTLKAQIYYGFRLPEENALVGFFSDEEIKDLRVCLTGKQEF